ncbi:MAG: hypothetical protein ACI90V_011156 [Bacillariaceae sp.]|jgi:hypothetical protein
MRLGTEQGKSQEDLPLVYSLFYHFGGLNLYLIIMFLVGRGIHMAVLYVLKQFFYSI